eukprot:GDKK01002823.1.p1 GENE.GDKK01002823.1~~GDKK01002823.1.p1  ORF type:complete len:111 (+),score=14.22 GDKK01002823.1:60-392(+)
MDRISRLTLTNHEKIQTEILISRGLLLVKTFNYYNDEELTSAIRGLCEEVALKQAAGSQEQEFAPKSPTMVHERNSDVAIETTSSSKSPTPTPGTFLRQRMSAAVRSTSH